MFAKKYVLSTLDEVLRSLGFSDANTITIADDEGSVVFPGEDIAENILHEFETKLNEMENK